MTYQKTNWVDHIVDPETGSVVQSGTKFTAARANKMEQGIADAHGLVEELAKTAVGSAVVSGLIFTSSGLTASYTAGTAYVNGVMFDVDAGSITLNPTQGQYIYLDNDGVVKRTTSLAIAEAKCLLWYFATDASTVITETDRRIHPGVADGSITDAKIGNRNIDPNTSTPFSLSGTVTQILSWIGKYLTQITGRPLFQAPRTTLENAVKRDGDTFGGVMTFDGGGQLVNLKPGTADHVYMGLYADSQAPNTRSGYIGYPNTGATSISIQNEMLNGDILIGTVGSGKVKINNNEALSTANGVKKMHGLPTGADLNTIVDSGFYRMESGHLNAPPACEFGQLLVMHGGGDTIAQIATGYQTRVSFIRHGNPTNVGGDGKWSPWYLMSQTHNFRETASSKDEATGVYKVVDYRRSDGTYYAQSVLSNPDTNGYFRTLSYTYYDQTGTVALQTDVWTITYDDEGKIISKVPNF